MQNPDPAARRLKFPAIRTGSGSAQNPSQYLEGSLLHPEPVQLSASTLIGVALQKPQGKLGLILIFLSCMTLLLAPSSSLAVWAGMTGLVSGGVLIGLSFFGANIEQMNRRRTHPQQPGTHASPHIKQS